MSDLCDLSVVCVTFVFFFFNDTATTEIYTLSLHDALPISVCWGEDERQAKRTAHEWWPTSAIPGQLGQELALPAHFEQDRKSTRLNSSHSQISYAVFCLKKKKKNKKQNNDKNKNRTQSDTR